MVYWTYFLVSFTKPNQSNLDVHLNPTIMPRGNVFEVNMNEFNLYCQLCKMKKHERSSHCSSCERCILKRDHHCVFIGNCVGYNNTRYFMNYLIWLIVNKLDK
jgi:hypothetical protein